MIKVSYINSTASGLFCHPKGGHHPTKRQRTRIITLHSFQTAILYNSLGILTVIHQTVFHSQYHRPFIHKSKYIYGGCYGYKRQSSSPHQWKRWIPQWSSRWWRWPTHQRAATSSRGPAARLRADTTRRERRRWLTRLVWIDEYVCHPLSSTSQILISFQSIRSVHASDSAAPSPVASSAPTPTSPSPKGMSVSSQSSVVSTVLSTPVLSRSTLSPRS
jgi:hypothetical protein